MITRQHILMIYIFPNLICVSVVEIRSCSPRTTDIWLVVIAWSYTYFYINIRILIRMSCFEFLQTCNASFCECKHNLKGNISVIACDLLAFLWNHNLINNMIDASKSVYFCDFLHCILKTKIAEVTFAENPYRKLTV